MDPEKIDTTQISLGKQAKSFHKKWWFWMVLVLLIPIGVAGYFWYVQIWKATFRGNELEQAKTALAAGITLTDPKDDFVIVESNDEKVNAEGKESANIHPSIMLPAGTKLLAPIDGVVASVTKLYSNDYSIQITTDGKQSGLIFGLEHIKNPTVEVDDKVNAGDPIAEVTDFTSEHHPGYGYFDLAVFSTKKDWQPQHHCPFLYLDDSVKDEIFAKIRALYTSWGKYTDNDKIYDEDTYTVPGCISTEPLDG